MSENNIFSTQITLNQMDDMNTYQWRDGKFVLTSNPVVGISGTSSTPQVNRMFFNVKMPTIPQVARITKATLTVYQSADALVSEQFPIVALYQAKGDIKLLGNCSPEIAPHPIDYAYAKNSVISADPSVASATYTFDVTSWADAYYHGEAESKLALKMLNENDTSIGNITLYGMTSFTTHPPTLTVEYETSFAMGETPNTANKTIGPFGEAHVDLARGMLTLETEDFSWSGNRMPVSIHHNYHGALSNMAYGANASVPTLYLPDYSGMRVGLGFWLNLMQSMIAVGDAYAYTDDMAKQYSFCEGTDDKKRADNSSYRPYVCDEDESMFYDAERKELHQGNTIYTFDNYGRLILMADEKVSANHITIEYENDRITKVTDGANRDFVFDYSEADGAMYLTKITAPDGTCISYEYDNAGHLTDIIYPGNRRMVFTYAENKLATIAFYEDSSMMLMKKLTFGYTSGRVTTLTECGKDITKSATTQLEYSPTYLRTVASTLDTSDVDGDETNVLKTVYTFDEEGNKTSEYTYTANQGNDGAESNICLYTAKCGGKMIGGIQNLLANHNFTSTLANWETIGQQDFSASVCENMREAYFGRKMLVMENNSETDNAPSGIYQTVTVLPSQREYTFSAYIKNVFSLQSAIPTQQAGVFLRVMKIDGTVLAESERIHDATNNYTRLVLHFVLPENIGIFRVGIFSQGSCYTYVNCLQLERGNVASDYNLLTNGGFDTLTTTGWICTGTVAGSDVDSFEGKGSLKVVGNMNAQCGVEQTIELQKAHNTRETFTLSGWAKAPLSLSAVTKNEAQPTPHFRLRAVVQYVDDMAEYYEAETYCADFSPAIDDWQVASITFTKSEYYALGFITIYCDYDYNMGDAYFDNICLVRNSLETNLSEEDFYGDIYFDEDTSMSAEPETEGPPAFEEVKDEWGNPLTETDFNDGEFGTLYRTFAYSDSGNNLASETDHRGYTTTYVVDAPTSRRDEITDRLGNKTLYSYDDASRVAKVSNHTADGTELAEITYQYDAFDNLTEIARGDGQTYLMAYNHAHQLASIAIQGKTEPLIAYTYKDHTGKIKSMTYANGDHVEASYNSLGQMVAEKWYDINNTLIAYYQYAYDSEENIVRTIDNIQKLEYNYIYQDGQIVRASEYAFSTADEGIVSKTWLATVYYTYNEEGKLSSRKICHRDATEQMVYYEYTEDDTQIAKFVIDGITITSHSKDDHFGRKVFDELQFGTGVLSRQFIYHQGDISETHTDEGKVKSSATTQLVSKIIFSDNRTIEYTYDAEERITQVADSINGTTLYTYDALGQLLSETVDSVTVNSMEYDNYGNITKKNDKVYTYDATWKDLLTSYDGQLITYDAQGNPTSYLGKTLTWQMGRQLKTLVEGEGDSRKTYTYTYNASGIRIGKTFREGDIASETRIHKYTLHGADVVRETVYDINSGGDGILYELYPLRDNEGAVCGIVHRASNYFPDGKSYTETPYFFQKNLQGDIIAITDQDASIVARYTYDAWGKILSVTDGEGTTISSLSAHIANINPYRYRGYYYDSETELYYLQSRYYDPVTGRFLNGDEAIIAFKQKQLFPNKNLFAYCDNYVIGKSDPFGFSPYTSHLNLVDYRIIHNRVANLIRDALGSFGVREVYVKGTYEGKAVRGFLDVYDSSNHAYYEVKSQPASLNAKTKKQMAKYDHSYVAIFPALGLVKRGIKKFNGSFNYGAWEITYDNTGTFALVVYKPLCNEQKVEYANATALALGCIAASYLALSQLALGRQAQEALVRT